MSVTGKEYKLAIRIAGVIDKSFNVSLMSANGSLKKAVYSLDSDFTRLDRGFDTIMGVGSKAFHAIASAAAVAATAIGAAAAAAINVGMEFEKQMATVQAISGASADELGRLTDKARELGRSSAFSATEVGQAMEYMGMAGWKTGQMLAGIEGVLNLAAASGEDLATVSDIVTDDLTAFHMEAEETARMVDVMAQAARSSNTNVQMMGETFKYAGTVAGAMGYQIEDLAIAAGLMASSGIKASNAGTALRNIISRMTKPTKESAEAMAALGLSLEREDGTMHSFLEIMEQMRKGMSGMTETQKAYYAASLGEQRGMAGLLAIANSTDQQFESLTDAIYNAEGAARQMAEIRLDNLAGDVEIFRDALADAGIELSQNMNGPLRGLVQTGTGIVNSAAARIPKAVQKISSEFPTLQRKFKKFAQPVFSGIMSAGSFIIRNGKAIISILAGIGAALAAYKAVSAVTHAVKAIMSLGSLNPVTLGIMAAVAAIGVLAGAITAIKQHEQELVDDSLARHFGDIVLSMEEIQAAAEHIVSSESLGGVRKALDAFNDLDGISSMMEENISAVDKMNWKISIGMELSEDEKETYKQEIDEYIKRAQDYALQSQYAVSLNMQLAFSEGDLESQNVVDKVNQFYADKYDELASLGTQLNEALTEAFNDGLLDIEETRVIADIQREMAEVQKSLATGEFNAQLSVLGMEYGGGNLTADSFQNLMDEVYKQVDEAAGAYKEAYIKNMAANTAAYEGGGLTDAEYNNSLEDLNMNYLMETGDLRANANNFLLDTIMNQYAGELDPAIESYMQQAQETLASYAEHGEWDWMDRTGALWMGMVDEFSSSDLDSTTKKAISQLMECMGPSVEEMREIERQYEALGGNASESFTKGLSNYSLLDAMVNADKESANYVLSEQLMASGLYDSFYKGMFEQADDRYGIENMSYLDHISAEIGNAAAAKAASKVTVAAESVIRPVVSGTYDSTQGMIDEYYSKGFEAAADLSVTLNTQYNNLPSGMEGLRGELKGRYGTGKNAGWASNIDHNAFGGFVMDKELSWLAENGPEAVVPLDGSQRAVSLWEKTGQLLGMDSILDRYDLNGGSQNTVKVEWKPTYQFYGEAPSKEDLTDAAKISQDEFDRHMKEFIKTYGRVSFG